MRVCLVMAVLGCLLGLPAGFDRVSAAEQTGAASDNKAEIVALQKERATTLQRLVKICVMQYQVGATTFDSVAAAQNEAVEAELELADKPEERVSLMTAQLKIADGVLKYLENSHNAGFKTTEADVLRAKSHYLDVKIKLLRERSKLKDASK